MSQELYKRYRPTKFKDVLGQEEAVQTLHGFIQRGIEHVPHSICFTGPTGCGKTTLARIMQTKLRCEDTDFFELNAAGDFRGVDMVRDIDSKMRLFAMSGGTRIWLLDEAHQLTTDAQDALLKMLEDTPEHVYFFLATTNPAKLKKTIWSRVTEIKVSNLAPAVMGSLLERVCKAEGFDLDATVHKTIIDCAEGSPRKALVLLNQIMCVVGPEQQLKVVLKADSHTKAIDVARMLFGGGNWANVAKVLRELDDDPETVRWVVLGYSKAVLLGGGKQSNRASFIISAFECNFYDSKAAGLANACYSVTKSKEGL